MNESNSTCPSCHAPADPGDRYCGKCGAALHGGTIKCPHCGEQIPSDSRFCGKCGQPPRQAEPALRYQRWQRALDEIAVRFEAPNLSSLVRGLTGEEQPVGLKKAISDLVGLFPAKLIIEEGTKAVLLQRGKAEVLAPGTYDRNPLIERLKSLVVEEPMAVVLLDDAAFEVPFRVQKLLTAENVMVGARGQLLARVEDPILLCTALMKGARRLLRTELADRLSVEIQLALLDTMHRLSLGELQGGSEALSRLRESAGAKLAPQLRGFGLAAQGLRSLEIEAEALEQFRSEKGKLIEKGMRLDLEDMWVQLRRREAQQKLAEELQVTRDDVNHERELTKLAQEREQLQREDAMRHATRIAEIVQLEREIQSKLRLSAKRLDSTTAVEETSIHLEEQHKRAQLEVTQAEKLAELYRRSQAASLDQLKTDADVAKFVHDLDKDKALREDERDRLVAELSERRDDRQQARTYLLQKVRLEQELEQKRLELEGTQRLDASAIDHELAVRRRTFDADQEEERLRLQQRLEADRAAIRLERERDQADLETLKELQNAQFEQDKARQQLTQEAAAHELQMEEQRLKARSSASVAALISMMQGQGDASGANQVMAELARAEQFKGMSVDAILALKAGDSPEVAKIFQERAKALGYEKLMEVQLKAAEDQVRLQKDHLEELKKLYQDQASAIAQTTGDAMQAVAGMGKAVAQGGRGETVVVNPVPGTAFQPGPLVIGRQPGAPAENQVQCPHCRAMQSESATFCNQCGGRIKAQEGSRPCPKCKGFIPPGNQFCPTCGSKAE